MSRYDARITSLSNFQIGFAPPQPKTRGRRRCHLWASSCPSRWPAWPAPPTSIRISASSDRASGRRDPRRPGQPGDTRASLHPSDRVITVLILSLFQTVPTVFDPSSSTSASTARDQSPLAIRLSYQHPQHRFKRMVDIARRDREFWRQARPDLRIVHILNRQRLRDRRRGQIDRHGFSAFRFQIARRVDDRDDRPAVER